MTIPVDSRLEVDSVDTFLILRSPDATAVGGYAIYGLWFFPEEDREKILKLLQRYALLATARRVLPWSSRG
jgi:mRNA-decapping enzyme 1B